MKVVLVGPADAAAVAAAAAPSLLPKLTGVAPYAGRPTELLAIALLGAGVEVELVTLSRSVSAPISMGDGPLSVLIGPLRSRGRARDLFRAERRALRTLLTQTDGEILHAHWTYEFAWSVLADRRPRVVTVHDAPLTIARRMPTPYRAVRTGMAYRVRAGSFRGIAVSPYLAARWRWEMLDPRPLEIIPNFVASVGRPARPAGAGTHRLVSVGDAGPRKNIPVLLRAFRLVRRRHPAATLRLVGPGLGATDPLTGWASAHGLGDGVEWLGHRDHRSTVAVMAGADVVVHPSVEESFGMSVAEAMAMGVPVVAGRRSGALPWLLDGGRAGVLVDVRSASSLAEGVLRVAEDPHLATRLGAAGADRIATHFSTGSTLQGHLRVYDQSTRRPPAAGRARAPSGEDRRT